jgi:two-component system, chemotaxis family, protein-glutamate methylesterase/glutaminase
VGNQKVNSVENEREMRVSPLFPGVAYDLVAIAASAGGLRAIMRILQMLPPDFPAAVAVVQHLDPHHPSMMVHILGRQTDMRVLQAANDLPISANTVYVAPPDHHMLVNPDRTISLSHANLVHFVRPSADLLFESAAATLHERVIAVVLSGTGMDGSLGVKAIDKMGGVVIAQDEATSEFFGMPGAAIQTGVVDSVLPLDAIAPLIMDLITDGEHHEQSPTQN